MTKLFEKLSSLTMLYILQLPDYIQDVLHLVYWTWITGVCGIWTHRKLYYR